MMIFEMLGKSSISSRQFLETNMDEFNKAYLNNLNDFHEDDEDQNIETYQDELEVNDPIFEIIEQVGEKYKKTWEELSK